MRKSSPSARPTRTPLLRRWITNGAKAHRDAKSLPVISSQATRVSHLVNSAESVCLHFGALALTTTTASGSARDDRAATGFLLFIGFTLLGIGVFGNGWRRRIDF